MRELLKSEDVLKQAVDLVVRRVNILALPAASASLSRVRVTRDVAASLSVGCCEQSAPSAATASLLLHEAVDQA